MPVVITPRTGRGLDGGHQPERSYSRTRGGMGTRIFITSQRPGHASAEKTRVLDAAARSGRENPRADFHLPPTSTKIYRLRRPRDGPESVLHFTLCLIIRRRYTRVRVYTGRTRPPIAFPPERTFSVRNDESL